MMREFVGTDPESGATLTMPATGVHAAAGPIHAPFEQIVPAAIPATMKQSSRRELMQHPTFCARRRL